MTGGSEPAGLDLRPARLDDPEVLRLVEEVQRYYVQVYGGPDDDPLQPADVAAPRGGFLLGRVDGAAVAMGGWSRAQPGEDVAHLRRMFVSPLVRRRAR